MELLDPEANQKAGELFKKSTELEPNFALGYTGLACFLLEEEGFRGQKPLLDSAVEAARRAIALDPSDVRSFTALARAYNRKGWHSQCDEALQKALHLGPNDDTANALAGIRALSKHEFVEAYHLFRKAYLPEPERNLAALFRRRDSLSSRHERFGGELDTASARPGDQPAASSSNGVLPPDMETPVCQRPSRIRRVTP